MNRRITLAIVAALFGMPGIAAQDAGMANTLTVKEKAAGWRLLFDGKTTAGWRGYRQDSIPDGWKAVDGALTRIGRGGDIITIDEFDDFELAVDWKLGPGGNSGIFYRVPPGVRTSMGRRWYRGPSMASNDRRVPEVAWSTK